MLKIILRIFFFAISILGLLVGYNGLQLLQQPNSQTLGWGLIVLGILLVGGGIATNTVFNIVIDRTNRDN